MLAEKKIKYRRFVMYGIWTGYFAVFAALWGVLKNWGVPASAIISMVTSIMLMDSISRRVVSHLDRVCPLCGQNLLQFIYRFEGRVYSGPKGKWYGPPAYYLCENCGARVARYNGGRWTVVSAAEWERMEEKKRSYRIYGAPYYDEGKAVNNFGDEVVAYYRVNARDIILIWLYRDVQTIAIVEFAAQPEAAAVLLLLEKAQVPEVVVDEAKLAIWAERWNQDAELRAYLLQDPAVSANFDANYSCSVVNMSSEVFEPLLHIHNQDVAPRLWRHYKDEEARQVVLQFVVWNELWFYAYRNTL